MPAFVALLRATNVGGRGTLAMAELRRVAACLGLRAPRTLLQSGNLVFSADDAEPEALERRIEAAVEAELRLATNVLVRDAAQWTAIMSGCPFAALARTDPSHVLAMTLRSEPTSEAEVALSAAIQGAETIAVRGATAYLAYPDGIGRSKLTPALIEHHLATIGTARNWNTVQKIAATLAADATV